MNKKVEDLLVSIVEKRPADAGEVLQDIMVEKLRTVVERRRTEVAEDIFNTNEESEDEDYLDEKWNPISRYKQAKRIKAKASDNENRAKHVSAYNKQMAPHDVAYADSVKNSPGSHSGYPYEAKKGESEEAYKNRISSDIMKDATDRLRKANRFDKIATNNAKRRESIGKFGVKKPTKTVGDKKYNDGPDGGYSRVANALGRK